MTRNQSKAANFFYIILILFAILFDYLELLSAPKTIGIGILAAIIVFVLKTLIGCNCNNKES